MLERIQFPGKYFQGQGAIADLPAIVDFFGKKGLVLTSGSGEKILAASQGNGAKKLETLRFGGECSQAEVARVTALASEKNADVLVGMGGGKAIDTAKIVADKLGIPVVIVPPIASTDAPCRGCALLYTDKGEFESVYYQKANPDMVLVDTAVIASAPVRFLVAGMGDALSTYFEARSCYAKKAVTPCGGLPSLTGMGIARLCYDTITRYGLAAKLACERHAVSPALDHVVEANILLSGVGFESGGLASAHGIHNGLTALPEPHRLYHGEKVAYGVLAGLALTDASPEETDAVYAFCESIGLPTTLADLGLAGYDRAHLAPAAEKACAKGECTHNEQGEITPQKVLEALIAADAIGMQRKRERL